ncbi:MAG TPA: methyltransferase, partial [Longimicrobiales bacterium]|nr:methyltransferase [Longimicrobiales bacterium]
MRDAAASELAARHAPALGVAGPCLVMEDPRSRLASALEAEGLEVSRWWRRAREGRPASSWPSGGPFGTVGLRLPRAKDELEMLVHAAAALLGPDGRLLVYGANDEGAGSAGRRIGTLFRTVRTVATGGRCRLILARRPDRAPIRGRLEDWCEPFDPGAGELPGRWASFPGVFAHGRLDGGTALLMERLPDVENGARVLDFGCGHGILGAVVGARTPEAEVE